MTALALSSLPDLDSGGAEMKAYRVRLLVAAVAITCFAGAAQAETYSKIVQQNCRDDYKKFCSEYGIESTALRSMDRVGRSVIVFTLLPLATLQSEP